MLQELERTLALLAFDDPCNSPFADLLLPAHRQQVKHNTQAVPIPIQQLRIFNSQYHPFLISMSVWPDKYVPMFQPLQTTWMGTFFGNPVVC